MVTLFLLIWPLGQGLSAEPTGKLEIPDHHAGMFGDNEIMVRAYDLQVGTEYRIKMEVGYHQNPRTPPESGSTKPSSYVEETTFIAEGTESLHTFYARLPDCHWQITAGFTLHYRNGDTWEWNDDEDATQGIDIWADCKTPPPTPPCSPGTGTPGYWMNHPDAWPVEEIVIGGVTYSKDGAISEIKAPVKKDKTYTMFAALVAARLNLLIGNDGSCITGTIDDADAWIATNPLGSGVKGNSDAWKTGEPVSWTLDQYNNGLLCAPARD